MPIPPLYVCPDCEPGPYFYAGKIIAKLCSACSDARRNAETGFDRARTGADRERLKPDRTTSTGIHPAIRRIFEGR